MKLLTKTKQDIYVSDQTAVAKVTLWEDHMNCFTLVVSYDLQNFSVRRYQSENNLTRMEESTLTITEDIGEVVPYIEDKADTLYNLEIFGVPSLNNQTLCLKCSSHMEPDLDSLGRCTNCKMPQKINLCPQQLSAKLVCMHDTSNNEMKLTQLYVRQNILIKLVGDSPVRAEDRLCLILVMHWCLAGMTREEQRK